MYWSGIVFNVVDVVVFVGYQNGVFKLFGFFCVNVKIGGKFYWVVYVFRYINKCIIRGYCCIKCGKEVVIFWYYGVEIFMYQFWVIVDCFIKGIENNFLFCQFFVISSGN